MLIKAFDKKKVLIDLEKDEISKKLRETLEGKRIVLGEDHIDDDFYRTENRPMIIDTINKYVYVQEDEDTIVMTKLLGREVVDMDGEGQIFTFTDEFRFKGKIEEIEKLWEQRITGA